MMCEKLPVNCQCIFAHPLPMNGGTFKQFDTDGKRNMGHLYLVWLAVYGHQNTSRGTSTRIKTLTQSGDSFSAILRPRSTGMYVWQTTIYTVAWPKRALWVQHQQQPLVKVSRQCESASRVNDRYAVYDDCSSASHMCCTPIIYNIILQLLRVRDIAMGVE